MLLALASLLLARSAARRYALRAEWHLAGLALALLAVTGAYSLRMAYYLNGVVLAWAAISLWPARPRRDLDRQIRRALVRLDKPGAAVSLCAEDTKFNPLRAGMLTPAIVGRAISSAGEPAVFRDATLGRVDSSSLIRPIICVYRRGRDLIEVSIQPRGSMRVRLLDPYQLEN